MEQGAPSVGHRAAAADTAGTASLPGAVVLALRAEGWSVFEDTSIAAAEGGPARRIGCVLLHEARGIALVDVVPGGEARIRRADDQTIAGRGGVPVAYVRMAASGTAGLPVLLGRLLPLRGGMGEAVVPPAARLALLRALGIGVPGEDEGARLLRRPLSPMVPGTRRRRGAWPILLAGGGACLVLGLVLVLASGGEGPGRRASSGTGSGGVWPVEASAASLAGDGPALPAVEAGAAPEGFLETSAMPAGPHLAVLDLAVPLQPPVPSGAMAAPPVPPPSGMLPGATSLPDTGATIPPLAPGLDRAALRPPSDPDVPPAPVPAVLRASEQAPMPMPAPALIPLMPAPVPTPTPPAPVRLASLAGEAARAVAALPWSGPAAAPPSPPPAEAPKPAGPPAAPVPGGPGAVPRLPRAAPARAAAATPVPERPARRAAASAAAAVAAAPPAQGGASRSSRPNAARCAALLRRLQLGEGPSHTERVELRLVCGPG